MKTNQSSGWAWHRIQQEMLERNRRDNDGQCQAQLHGCEGLAAQVHHRVERIDGGGDGAENLMAICETCHVRLTTELNQRLARERRVAKREAKRRNHPGRKDRHA